MQNILFKRIYFYLSLFYVATIITLWLVFFIPELKYFANYVIFGVTGLLIFFVKIDYFEVFFSYIYEKGGNGFQLAIFTWVALSGLSTIFRIIESLIF